MIFVCKKDFYMWHKSTIHINSASPTESLISHIICFKIRINLQFILGFLHMCTLHYLCFVHYAKSTPQKGLHLHSVHLASMQHIKSRKAQMAEHFVSFAQALSEHCTCLYLASVWSTGGDVESKRKGVCLAWQNLSFPQPLHRFHPDPLQQSCRAVHIHFVRVLFKAEPFTYHKELLFILKILVLEILME